MATELAPAEREQAITAHALYLANLLIAPLLGFVALYCCRRRWMSAASPLLRHHLDRAFAAAIWSGGLIVLVSLLLALFGDLHQAGSWVVLILYFTLIHAALVLSGAYALACAMNSQPCRYPLPGLWRQDGQEESDSKWKT